MECKQTARRIAAMLMCAMMLCSTAATAFADTLAYTNKKTTVYVEKSGSLKKAGTAAKGTEVTITEVNGSWAKVEKDGNVAYMKLSSLSAKAANSYGKTVKCNKAVYAADDGVKVYKSDDEDSDVLATLTLGQKQTMVAYNDVWCMVKNGKFYGYVLREELSLDKIAVSAPEATQAPAKEKVTKCSKYVYAAADGVKVFASDDDASAVKDTLTQGQKVKMTAYTDTWCQIKSGSKIGYVLRSEMSLEKVAAKQEPATKVVKCNKAVYVAVDGAKVYASASDSAKVQDTLALGQKLTMTAYDDTWCLVKSGSKAGYMLRSQLSLTKIAAATPAPTATSAPTAAPQNVTKCDKTGYAVSDGVKVYAEANTGSNVIGTLNKNASVNVIGYTEKWCQVKNGKYIGYVQQSDLSETKAAELPSALEYGDKGDAVKLLQTRLKELGYFNGSIGGNYLEQTRTAVMAFQSQHKLTVDGEAGEKTLSMLFSDKAEKFDASKVETSTGGSTAGGPTNALVQEMDWWTSGIQSIFARGTTATITDCKTGISWKERRTGGTNHADAQPVTAADTAAMKSAVGKWSWERRPIWVTINGKNYAASMNCMPHGGDSIADNNFDGHHCIHFTNSRTHGTNSKCSQHQAAIKKALTYNMSK